MSSKTTYKFMIPTYVTVEVDDDGGVDVTQVVVDDEAVPPRDEWGIDDGKPITDEQLEKVDTDIVWPSWQFGW